MASYGLIIDIKEHNIDHNCNTGQGTSGSPILSLENNKVIGVQYRSSDKFKYNKGNLIVFAIIMFYKMISEKSIAIKRIKNEIQFISNYPFLDIGINVELPRDNNIFEWKGFLIGPDDTSYKGGIFYFKIKFSQNYPKSAPEIIFLTPIYHVNVNHINSPSTPLGHVFFSFLNHWNEEYKIREILIKLYTIFYLSNPNSPFGDDRANEIRYNRQLFEEKVKYFTKKYANINNASNIYKVWDFTYNIKDDKNNDYINITFELDGINRFSCQAKKNEITKNVVLNYCQSAGMERNYKDYFYYFKSKRLILYKALEENGIDNNSLIIVIDGSNIILSKEYFIKN